MVLPPVDPRVITIRASAVSDFFDCPARAEAKHLLGKMCANTGASALGTAVHAGTALFDKARLEGNPILAHEAAGAVVDAIRRPDEDVAWEDVSVQDAERVALALHSKYCNTVAPRFDYAAVELTCDPLLIPDLNLALTGTTDRVRKAATGALGIADLKTGKWKVAKDGTVDAGEHKVQLGIYELIASATLGEDLSLPPLIIGMNTAKTADAQRVGYGEVNDTREMLVGTEERPGLLQMLASMLHSGSFYGNPRSQLCTPRWCPVFKGCRYRD